MRKRNHFFALFCLLTTAFMWSFDLSLAELYEYNPEGGEFFERGVTRDLFNGIRVRDHDGILTLSLTKETSAPKSILDIALLSESEKVDFILYGFLKVTGNYSDFEVKLYDRAAGEVKKVFYAKSSATEYENLLQTMSDRIVTYFFKTMGVANRKVEAEKERGVIDIETGLGYWIPFDPWAKSLMGLVSFHLSSSLAPVDPLFKWDIFTFALSYGIGLDYSLGMNKKGFESYFFHSLRMGFPVTLSAIWYNSNKIIFQLTPELQLDLLVQDRLYGSLTQEISTAFSLTTAIGYENLFINNRTSLGFLTSFHTAFYKEILFSVEPSFYCRYRFNPINQGD